MSPYIKIFTVFILFILVIVVFNKPPKTKINYEWKYDSIKQQLQLELANRVTYTHTIDSLTLVSDSLTKVKEQIQVEIRYIPGKYNQYNSEELQQKMIEAYEEGCTEL